MESRVKDGNYYVVQSFMVKDIGLKGLEKDVYAIIYGFSQAEKQVFNGSLQYLADWTNSTKQGIMKCLKNLQEKGLINKQEKNNGNLVEYYTTEFNSAIKLSLTPTIKHSLTNNIDNNIQYNIKNNKENKANLSFDEIINNFTEYEPLRIALIEYVKMRKLIKKPLTSHGLQLCLIKKNSGLFDLSGGNEKLATEIVNQSICNSWQGLFPLKKVENKKMDMDKHESIIERYARL